MKRRLPILLLAIACILPVLATAASALGTEDLSLYRPSIQYLSEKGYLVGNGAEDFDPESTMTRGQFVVILYRMSDCPSVSDMENPFEDVEKGSWYEDAVIWAAANNVVKGITEDTFDPDAEITREQIAVMLFRYAQAFPVARNHLSRFQDNREVSEYAREALNWAVAMGIVSGVTENTLEAKASISCAQAANMLYRYLNPADVSIPQPPVSNE